MGHINMVSGLPESQIVYFSIGDAIAALGITLAIPQFLKPIYRFRLSNMPIGLYTAYTLVFAGAAFAFVAALIPKANIPDAWIVGISIFWELLSGVAFASGLLIITASFLIVAKLQKGKYKTFVNLSGRMLAHADDVDRVDFVREIIPSIPDMCRAAVFLERAPSDDAFYSFTHDADLRDGECAVALLRLMADPSFCETIVSKCSWDSAELLVGISKGGNAPLAAELFVREIGRQAIRAERSALTREMEFGGLREAPVLTAALFSDEVIVRAYSPISGIRYDDLRGVRVDFIRSLSHASEQTILTLNNCGDYWSGHGIYELAEKYEWICHDIVDQIKVDPGKKHLISYLRIGVRNYIKLVQNSFVAMNEEIRRALYAVEYEALTRKFNVVQGVAELVVRIMCGNANNFSNFDDPFWSINYGMMDQIFPRFGNIPVGMNPLQQRVAILLIAEMKENMKGRFPAVSKIILATIGPIGDDDKRKIGTAFEILKDAIYKELGSYKIFYQEDPERAQRFLPGNVRYSIEHDTLFHRYRNGLERATELARVHVGAVNLYDPSLRRDYSIYEQRHREPPEPLEP
ncbi:hypothetical protein FFK22_024660 [Mycobacterium sp. KBS0706]|uniref:hypothetical protein n=1 Tax=Mycobacterium sp. KBS0706 TaxID=2578109 RepID=UPI00110FA1F6|nr:hypothetical protein [Mycobacterium sp. KBS0706]TSD86014.1 hypothetical protein FFK22_024660 [Mycobacterium sp. KBS0706]